MTPISQLKSVSQWHGIFSQPDKTLWEKMADTYGPDRQVLSRRIDAFRQLTGRAVQVFDSEADALLVRVPGRINLMGVHTDGQRAYKNYVLFAREIIALAQPRTDSLVRVENVDSQYQAAEFSIAQEFSAEKRGDWLNYISQVQLIRGSWINYVKAGILSLQNAFPESELPGLNLLVSGDIPRAAGTSSSSALVVAAALAAAALNQLQPEPGEFVRLCGEGEWYTGTRGGMGDQAAQVFCRRGRVLHLRFTPSGFSPYDFDYSEFPSGYRLLLCNSGKEARKAMEAREKATARSLASQLGLMILRDKFPYLRSIEYLAEITPERLRIAESKIYRMLKVLPETATVEEMRDSLSDKSGELDTILRLHHEVSGPIPVRPVCLYLMAECRRSEKFRDLLRSGKINEVGRLMFTAHDGDRLVGHDRAGQATPWDGSISDQDLDRLITGLESSDPAEREQAQIYHQPGGFGCSSEELDLMVDICAGVPGVVGARLTGAGMGGCIIALVEEGKEQAVADALEQDYYRPRGLPVSIEPADPIAGAGVLEI